MAEQINSYYKSTDDLGFSKKPNYFDLFQEYAESDDSSDIQYYYGTDEVPSYDFQFTPTEYKIKTVSSPSSTTTSSSSTRTSSSTASSFSSTTTRRTYPKTWVVDSVIAGLIDIMDSDPNLKGKFRITSLYREGARTKSGNPSYHGSGRAVDIVPTSGTFEDLEASMMSNPVLVKYMSDNKLGILDEYTPNGYQARTGATGNHMHIGPDRLALQCQHKLLIKYGWA